MANELRAAGVSYGDVTSGCSYYSADHHIFSHPKIGAWLSRMKHKAQQSVWYIENDSKVGDSSVGLYAGHHKLLQDIGVKFTEKKVKK